MDALDFKKQATGLKNRAIPNIQPYYKKQHLSNFSIKKHKCIIIQLPDLTLLFGWFYKQDGFIISASLHSILFKFCLKLLHNSDLEKDESGASAACGKFSESGEHFGENHKNI